MKTSQPCELCPCKPTTPAMHRHILRSMYDEIKASGGFPCHDRHPDAHALNDAAIGADGKYHATDCAGYKIWGLAEREEA
jgi:hypothetical protein